MVVLERNNEMIYTHDWDIMYVGTEKVPGYVSVATGLTLGIKESESKGVDSPTNVPTGLQLVKLVCNSKNIDTNADEQWATFLQKIEFNIPGKQKQPFEIVHPSLNIVGRNKFYFNDVQFPQPAEGAEWIVTFQLTEASDPKPQKTSTKPKATVKQQNKLPPPTPGLSPSTKYVPRG